MPEPNETELEGGTDLNVRRRDVMKAAGAAGVIGSGATGSASAQEDCDVACQAGRGPDNCSCVQNELDTDCEFLGKFQVDGGKCAQEGTDYEVPEGADHAAIKAGQDCILHGDDPGETLEDEICISADCSDISHIEFYDCLQPRVIGFSADCSTLTIETEEADGATITVDYRLQLVDDDGNVRDVVDADGVSVTDDDGNGVYTIDVSGATDDPWNRAALDEVVHEDGTDMLTEGSFDKFQDTPELCNPPAVTDLAVDCDGVITITTTNTPEGDTLSVDYMLEELDADGNLVGQVANVTDASATVDANGVATIDTGETGWNVVEVTSVVHDASDHEMLDSAQRLIVTV